MGFQSVTGKLGNMRKIVDWTVCPVNTGEGIMVIQSSRRIAKIDTKTGKAVLSKSANYPIYMMLNEFMGAKECDCPQDIIDQLNDLETSTGPVRIV